MKKAILVLAVILLLAGSVEAKTSVWQWEVSPGEFIPIELDDACPVDYYKWPDGTLRDYPPDCRWEVKRVGYHEYEMKSEWEPFGVEFSDLGHPGIRTHFIWLKYRRCGGK